MSWLFSRVLVEEYSAANSLDGKPSAPSNAMLTPQAYLWRDKTTDAWKRFPSGMTCEPLTDDRGEVVLTWFREGSHARTSVAPAKEPELTENEADSGRKCSGWFAKWERDSSSWKTPQCSLLAGLDVFSATWPRWGTMRNGVCLEREMLEHRTTENESGFWPTPTANDAKKGGNFNITNLRNGLSGAVRKWPTPTARDWKAPGDPSRREQRMAERAQPLSEVIGGKLNPTWVEWLMGWPIGWTDLNPLEMDKFHRWQQQHSQHY